MGRLWVRRSWGGSGMAEGGIERGGVVGGWMEGRMRTCLPLPSHSAQIAGRTLSRLSNQAELFKSARKPPIITLRQGWPARAGRLLIREVNQLEMGSLKNHNLNLKILKLFQKKKEKENKDSGMILVPLASKLTANIFQLSLEIILIIHVMFYTTVAYAV